MDAETTEAASEAVYRQHDLYYKEKTLNIDRRSLFVSVAGFVLVLLTLLYNSWQWAFIAKTHHNAIKSSMLSLMVDLDKVYLEHPELVPYFYGGLDIATNHPDYRQAYATAVMVLDVMDIGKLQSTQFKEFWTHPETWEEWIQDQFADSPIVCRVFAERRNWYGSEMTTMYDEGIQRRAKRQVASNRP